MDEVGPKAVEDFSDKRDVTRKGGVEAEVLFEGERENSSRQFEGPDIAFFDEGLIAISCANTEKGQVLAAGESLKVAAGVRNAV